MKTRQEAKSPSTQRNAATPMRNSACVRGFEGNWETRGSCYVKNAGLHGLRSDHKVEDEVQGRWGRLVQPEEAQLSQP